ncbi:IS110 family RNA-guided transposase [Muricoccus vinaceus]|uniref:IS110 family transposase n=1 Tax=Muricoccus vinaceus TaxID=424704 RepID=A0ABV6ITD1_9PROT
MERYVGLDVSQEQTSVWVVDSSGKTVWQGKCASTPEAIAATIRAQAPEVTRVGLESGPMSAWHWHELRKAGLPVVCLDARHAKVALALQLNKSDRNDARGLAQIVRTGWYREVAVKGMDSHLVRSLLTTRAQLVRMRVDLANQIRGVLKPFGLIAGKGGGQPFAERVRALVADGPLQDATEALLAAWQSVSEQVAVLSRRLVAIARQDGAVRRLMTAPGVGVLVALTYVSVVDTPERFAKSSSVGAYVGLTPRRYQSGEEDYTGHISRCGDKLLRTYLYEAAGIILHRVSRWSALKAWGTQLAKRTGTRKATVAVARKLSVILHRMLRDGSEFRWSTKEAQMA